MRILHVNKFAWPKGGAEIYMLRTAAKQLEQAHTVAVFGDVGANGPGVPELLENAPTGEQGRNLQMFDLPAPDYRTLSAVSKAQQSISVLWSNRARQAVSNAIDEFRPDIVHIHNYAHQLSSSIIALMNKRGVPFIHTAHDYKLVCPAYTAYVDGSACSECFKHLSSKLLKSRCHHNSFSWSALVGAEAAFVRSRNLAPSRIIAPSEYMRHAIESSWTGARSTVALLRNPADRGEWSWRGGDYLLYVGRLSREKGVGDLVLAARTAGIKLVIAGDGPLRSELEALSDRSSGLVTLVGHVGSDELNALRQHCMAQVVPSTWPENAPLAALEASVNGVPVVATAVGGLPELAGLGADLRIVEKFAAETLLDAVESAPADTVDLERFTRAVSWDHHLDGLVAEYEKGIHA